MSIAHSLTVFFIQIINDTLVIKLIYIRATSTVKKRFKVSVLNNPNIYKQTLDMQIEDAFTHC